MDALCAGCAQLHKCGPIKPKGLCAVWVAWEQQHLRGDGCGCWAGGAGLLLLLPQVSEVSLLVRGITFCGGAPAAPLQGHAAAPMAALGHHSL